MRDRSMAFVVRDKKLLVEKLHYGNRSFYSIPGGGIEEGETPEETALRELREECGLEGTIVRPLTVNFNADGSKEYVFEVKVPIDQTPILGYDPEEPEDKQAIKEVRWMSLDQLSEKDRAFMWAYGLLGIEGFFEETLSWGETVSYPTC